MTSDSRRSRSALENSPSNRRSQSSWTSALGSGGGFMIVDLVEILGHALVEDVAHTAELAVERGDGALELVGHGLERKAVRVAQVQDFAMVFGKPCNAGLQELLPLLEVVGRRLLLSGDGVDELI